MYFPALLFTDWSPFSLLRLWRYGLVLCGVYRMNIKYTQSPSRTHRLVSPLTPEIIAKLLSTDRLVHTHSYDSGHTLSELECTLSSVRD